MMQSNPFVMQNIRNSTAILAVVACWHLIAWTLVFTLSLPTPNFDIMEASNWAHHWQWGYQKHPPLYAWITEFLLQAGGRNLWVIYLAIQLLVVSCLWTVWKLSRCFLDAQAALLGMLLLETIPFYSVFGRNLNGDSVLLALWVLALLFLWRALISDRNARWLFFGISIGLGFLAKYTIVFLLFPITVFLLFHPAARRCFRKPGPYLALGIAAAIALPHLIWMLDHDFITIHYALGRAGNQAGFIGHVLHPVLFFRDQVLLLPMLLAAAILVARPLRFIPLTNSTHFSRWFLFTAALGPLLTLLAISAVFGFKLRQLWEVPMWSMSGTLIFTSFKLSLTPKRISFFVCVVAVVSILMMAGTVAARFTPQLLSLKPSDRFYPAKDIAETLGSVWRARYAFPLPVVAGSMKPTHSTGFFLKDRPDVYIDLDPKISPWTGDEDFKRRGGIIVFDESSTADFAELRKRFPNLMLQPAVSVPWLCGIGARPVQLRVALVPPS